MSEVVAAFGAVAPLAVPSVCAAGAVAIAPAAVSAAGAVAISGAGVAAVVVVVVAVVSVAAVSFFVQAPRATTAERTRSVFVSFKLFLLGKSKT